MNRVGIVGGGVLGRQFLSLFRAADPGLEWVFFDDRETPREGEAILPFEAYRDGRHEDLPSFVALGYLHLEKKRSICSWLEGVGRLADAHLHESASLSPSGQLGPGSVAFPGCVVGDDVRIGSGVVLNNSVTVSHDCEVGDSSYLSPGVVVCGNCVIGREVFVGAGSIISDGVVVGDNAVVGIGTVVTRDVDAGSSVIGNPMRVLEKPLDLQ